MKILHCWRHVCVPARQRTCKSLTQNSPSSRNAGVHLPDPLLPNGVDRTLLTVKFMDCARASVQDTGRRHQPVEAASH